MASTAAKARRRAEALNELDRLSNLLADKTGVAIPNLRPQNRDPELKSIERIEAINGLLAGVLKASGVEVPGPVESVPEAEEGAAQPGTDPARPVVTPSREAVDAELETAEPKATKRASKRSSKKGRK